MMSVEYMFCKVWFYKWLCDGLYMFSIYCFQRSTCLTNLEFGTVIIRVCIHLWMCVFHVWCCVWFCLWGVFGGCCWGCMLCCIPCFLNFQLFVVMGSFFEYFVYESFFLIVCSFLHFPFFYSDPISWGHSCFIWAFQTIIKKKLFIYYKCTQIRILFFKNYIIHMWFFIILTLLQPGAEIFNDRLSSVSGNVLDFLANIFL